MTVNETELTAAFERIHVLCETRDLAIPELASFHRQTFPSESRVGLFAPPGSGVMALYGSLTGVVLQERDARATIHEAARGTSLVSLALCGTIDSGVAPAEWLDRVAVAVVVTPAAAVLGKTEVGMMRQLAACGRDFAVVILGIDGVDAAARDAALREIENFKLRPLEAEIGPFLSIVDDGTKDVAAELWQWADARIVRGKTRQIALVATKWLDDLGPSVEAHFDADGRRAARLGHVDVHREALGHYLRDAPARESAALVQRLRAAQEALDDACAAAAETFAAWLADPRGSWRKPLQALHAAKETFTNDVRDLAGLLARGVGAHVDDQVGRFCSAYGDVVEPLTVGPIAPQLTDVGSSRDLFANTDDIAQDYVRNYVSGPIRRSASKNATLREEITDALTSAVRGAASTTLARALSELDSVLRPAVERDVENFVQVFDNHVRNCIAGVRKTLVWSEVRTELHTLREEWTRFLVATSERAKP